MNAPAVPPNEPANELGVTPDAPWLGLRSFPESVRDYFYGRDAEFEELRFVKVALRRQESR
jgi:hypothetical protein